MQISGVSLALTWPCRLCLLRFLLCMSLCYKLSPFQALGKVTLHPCSQACMFIYCSCGKWVFPPPSCAVFLPPPLLQAFLLLLTWWCCCSCQPPCLFTAHVGSGSSSSPVEFSSLHHSHKLSHSWLLGTRPGSHQSLSGPPSLFIYSPRKDSLPPIFGAQCIPPSFPSVCIVFIAY
jgi:hypothetical protein